MATLTIRNLDDAVKERLRIRAAHNGRSMEAEVREIIVAAIGRPLPPETGLGTITRDMFAGLGWDGSTLPARDEPARYVDDCSSSTPRCCRKS